MQAETVGGSALREVALHTWDPEPDEGVPTGCPSGIVRLVWGAEKIANRNPQPLHTVRVTNDKERGQAESSNLF